MLQQILLILKLATISIPDKCKKAHVVGFLGKQCKIALGTLPHMWKLLQWQYISTDS